MRTIPWMRPCAAKWNFICICFLVLLAVVSGCSRANKPPENNRSGGVLYFGLESQFHGFDVLAGSGYLNPPMAPLNNLIQEPLFRMDRSGNLIPILGLSATPSDDGRQWDIVLRKNVVFHDGTPFNADAVRHHWERMLDSQNNYRGRPIFQPITRVEKIDEFTLRFILEHPWQPFLEVFSDELLMFNFIPSPKAVAAGTHDRKPVGTGPFKYFKWGSGDHFVVLKNENYWQKGKPLLNKVVFRAVPDHQTRYASLLSGELDVIILDRGNLIKKAKSNPELYAFHSEGNGAEIVMINTARPPLDDIRVRRALALANNQAVHIKVVYSDTIPLVHHPFGQGFECSDDGYLEYNPEKARQLIAEYGRPVEIECLHSNTSRGRDIGALLQQLFKDIGVTLKPVGLSTGPQVMRVLNKDYQLATWRIPPTRDHGPLLYRGYHSQSPTNFNSYSNPRLDRLLELQRIATDREQRNDLKCQIIRQLNQDVPFLYRGGRRYHIVARKKIRQMMDSPGFMVDLSTAWLDEKVKFNAAAYEIEKKAAVVEIDCKEPGDTAVVKAKIIGSWKGKDSWGGTLNFEFSEDDKITGTRSGGYNLTGNYIICGQQAIWQSSTGALVKMTVLDDKLEGTFERGGYSGTISMERN